MRDLALAIRLEVLFAGLQQRGYEGSRADYVAWCKVTYIRKALDALNVP